MGALTNCWVVLWCCVDSLVVIGAGLSPKDVLFHYNLDDIGGDLGFVNADDWPGLRLGWVCQEMVDPQWTCAGREKFEDAVPCLSYLVGWVYAGTMFMLSVMALVLPGLCAMTSFREIVPS